MHFLVLQVWSRFAIYPKMNEKARELGMRSTRFSDSSGLSDSNISSAMDLVKLAKYSLNKAQIKIFLICQAPSFKQVDAVFSSKYQ